MFPGSDDVFSLWDVLVTSLLNAEPIKVQRKQGSEPMAEFPSSPSGCYLYRVERCGSVKLDSISLRKTGNLPEYSSEYNTDTMPMLVYIYFNDIPPRAHIGMKDLAINKEVELS